MRMHHLAAAAGVLALTLVASCNDETPRPEKAVAPVAAKETAALTPDGGPNMAVAIGNQVASICKTYRKSLVQAKKDLIKNPEDAQLQADVKALGEMIDDACN
ncbi:MAG TPA: hypothetical protein VF608_11980 [Thermoanaerobaculia bacterium]